MSSSFFKTFIGCGLLLLSSGAVFAQGYGYPGYGDRPYYGERPNYQGSDEGLGLYERVDADLDRAAYDVYGAHHDLNHARKEVHDVMRQFQRGRFDRDEMGEAIGAVQRVLGDDRLIPQDRSILWHDLQRMRYFRDQAY